MQKKSSKTFEFMKAKNFLTSIICTIVLVLPIVVSASNENPTVKSEIAKDGSWDFDVTLSDITLDNSTEYEWAVVENQVIEPTTWYDLNSFETNKINIKLDFSVKKINQVLASVDTAYIIVREKQSEMVVLNHIVVDVSVPYAYGAVPIRDSKGNWKVAGDKFVCSVPGLSCYEERKYTAVKITDQNIIDSYISLKQQNNILDPNTVSAFVDSLNLTEKDIPANFMKESKSNSFTISFPDDVIGISDSGLYFVWGAQSYSNSKTIYGVTIYDNNYQDSSNNTSEDNVTPTPNIDDKKNDSNSKETSNTVNNPDTGVVSIGLAGIVLVIITAIICIIFKRKNKITRI